MSRWGTSWTRIRMLVAAGCGGVASLAWLTTGPAADWPVRQKSLAQSAFDTADAEKKGYLDGRSLRTARRVLVSALQRDARQNFPGGVRSAEGVLKLASYGNVDADGDERVSREEFVGFVTQVQLSRNAALAEAREAAEKQRQTLLKAQEQRRKEWLKELQRMRSKRR